MLVQNSQYPEFVADQLLTSENLNDLFGYLDEQGRMTRTNLIGIGIVCGLEVKTSADGTAITISKGTGVTSEGYLVSINETTYTDYVDFDPLKEKYYEKFVNTAGDKSQLFEDIWELKESAVEDATKLTQGFLAGDGTNADKKVVLLFVELLQLGNKNCNPNSCDDKGITIEVNIRPLLVRKADVDTYALNAGTGSIVFNQQYTALEEMRMPRFDVPNTRVATSADLFRAYATILDNTFLNKVESLLTSAWNAFSSVVGAEYGNVNPFSGLASAFSFVNGNSMDSSKVIYMQYYYDHFSDLIAAYEEFRQTGMEILSTCCPDSTLFPRHLLLDLAIADTTINYSQYRHYFNYSPLFQQKDLVGKMKMLFKRLALMRSNFVEPVVSGSNSTPDSFQRITPSRLDASFISNKAIPYYYRINNPATNPLYKNWSYERFRGNAANKNLSYNASEYASGSSADFVLNPLKYDLEPYNFLRIEGIVGKSYTHVLRNLKRQIQQNRLPFDVIAVNTDDLIYSANLASRNSKSLNRLAAMSREGLGDLHCYFNDLEAIYDSIKNEMLCSLCKELRYYYEMPMALGALLSRLTRTGAKAAAAELEPFASKVPLFERCTKVPYMVNPNSFGFVIEKIYEHVGNDGEVTIQEILEALGFDENSTQDNDGDGIPDSTVNANLVTAIMLMMPILELPIYIIRLSNYFTEDLHNFDVRGYCRMHERITQKANGYKRGANLVTSAQRNDIQSSLRTETTNYEDTEAADPTTNIAGAPAAYSKENTNPLGTRQTQTTALASMQNGLAYLLLFTLLLEDLFDHLDTLIYNCKCRALMGLKEEYLKRLMELTELRQFQHFSRRHPGLQHKAGVTMGGTFVIVYHFPDRNQREIDSTDNDRRLFNRNNKAMVSEKEAMDEKRMAKNSKEEASDIAYKRDKYNSEREKEAYYEEQEAIEIKRRRKTRLSDPIERAAEDLAEGVVIADFYLPYLCYSNCPPIVYQVNDIPDIPEKVSLSLQINPMTGNNVYSVNDESPYTFTKSPDGGTLNNATPENGVTEEGGQAIFTPIKVKELLGIQEKTEIGFTYSFNGSTSNSITATVYNAPLAKIIISPNQKQFPVGSEAKFESETKFADKFSWVMGETEVSTQQHLGLQNFKEEGSFTITFYAIQSDTGETATDTVTIEVIAKPSAIISTTPTVTGAIAIGSTINFNATTQNADSFKWLKNNAAFSTEKTIPPQLFDKTGTFAFKLQVTNTATGETADSNTITITVAGTPTAFIKPDKELGKGIAVGTAVTFAGDVQNADTYEWTMKNAAGALIDKAETLNYGPVPFNTAGTFIVGLTVRQSTTGNTATAADVVVTVLSNPTVSIALNPATSPTTIPAPARVSLSSTTTNADTFQWFKNTSPISGATNKDLKDHAISVPGSYAFTLRATQELTGKTATSNEVKIAVIKDEKPIEKSCGPLAGILEAFSKLPDIDRKNYPIFNDIFLTKEGINSYFRKLMEVANSPVEVQLAFFEEDISSGATIAENLSRWMNNLAAMIRNEQFIALRLLALEMYRILAALAMYIVCIQKTDIGKEAVVPIQEVFESMFTQLDPKEGILSRYPKMTTEQQDRVKELVTNMKAESERVSNNGEATIKKLYLDLLQRLQDLISERVG